MAPSLYPSPASGGGKSRLERAIPRTEIDVGFAYFDAVQARVTHELRRLIKSHRLAVENGGAEHVRIVAFDERRSVDQQRETRRVAFRKAVFAEPFDLAETMLGKFTVVAALGHAADELVAKQMDLAGMPEGRHGAAQPVGLVGREFRRRNRDLHRLFLKQRHAEGPFEDVLQFVGRSMRRSRGAVMLLLD